MSRKYTVYIAYFVIILLLSVLLVGESLSWFSAIDNQNNNNTITSGDIDFALTVKDENQSVLLYKTSAKLTAVHSFSVSIVNSTSLEGDEYFRDFCRKFEFSVENISDTESSVGIDFKLSLEITLQETSPIKYAILPIDTSVSYFFDHYNDFNINQAVDNIGEIQSNQARSFYVLFWIDGTEVNSGWPKPVIHTSYSVNFKLTATQISGLDEEINE